MQMMMMIMMMMATGVMSAEARYLASVPSMNTENVDDKNNDDEVKDA